MGGEEPPGSASALLPADVPSAQARRQKLFSLTDKRPESLAFAAAEGVRSEQECAPLSDEVADMSHVWESSFFLGSLILQESEGFAVFFECDGREKKLRGQSELKVVWMRGRWRQ